MDRRFVDRRCEAPSERVRELIRQGAKMILDGSQQGLEALHQAVLASEYMRPIVDDPVIVEAIRRSNRANHLHWATANVSRPGEPVPANVAAEPLAAARSVVGRGVDDSAVMDAYRLAQDVACRLWMQIAFRLTSDPDELRELLDVSTCSIASFLGATAAGICQRMRTERDEFTRGDHVERRGIVTRILDGATDPQQDAENRLGYRLTQHHTAAVIWGDEADTDLSDLDVAAEVLTHTFQGCRPLSVLADVSTRWVWLPGTDIPDLTNTAGAVGRLPGVRIAVGPTQAGIEGFRRSHLDALLAQRMMVRFGLSQRVTRFADIALTALVSADPEQADQFIKRTLGDFESADAELQRTVLTFIHEQCNASRTAARLFIHRNTLLRRLARAAELLPQSLEDASVHTAVALEAIRWRTPEPSRL